MVDSIRSSPGASLLSPECLGMCRVQVGSGGGGSAVLQPPDGRGGAAHREPSHDWHLGCILPLSRVPGMSCEQVLRAIKVRLASVVLGA